MTRLLLHLLTAPLLPDPLRSHLLPINPVVVSDDSNILHSLEYPWLHPSLIPSQIHSPIHSSYELLHPPNRIPSNYLAFYPSLLLFWLLVLSVLVEQCLVDPCLILYVKFICGYNSFSFLSVIFSLLFLVVVFLLVVLNSSYWLCFIIIFYVHGSEIHFIYANPFIFRFLVLIATSNHPVTVSLFLSQHNGVVSLSPLLIVIFVVFLFFLIAHEWYHSLGLMITLEVLFWEKIVSLCIIIVLSMITMVLFHWQRCWLLYIEVFLWILPTDERDHLLGSLLKLKVLFWAIIFSLYIIIVFSAQLCCFTVTVVYCNFF